MLRIPQKYFNKFDKAQRKAEKFTVFSTLTV